MQLEATMTEIIEGPIAAVDRVYAFDEIRRICEAAPRAVQRVRARLAAEPLPAGDGAATAECWLLLEGGLIICAGTAASSMRGAVDALMPRLRRRLDVLQQPASGTLQGSCSTGAANGSTSGLRAPRGRGRGSHSPRRVRRQPEQQR